MFSSDGSATIYVSFLLVDVDLVSFRWSEEQIRSRLSGTGWWLHEFVDALASLIDHELGHVFCPESDRRSYTRSEVDDCVEKFAETGRWMRATTQRRTLLAARKRRESRMRAELECLRRRV